MAKEKLHNIPPFSGFKMPEGYNATLEDKLFKVVKRLDNDKATTPLPDTSGFKLPETYLDTLEDTISNTIATPKATKIVTLFSKKTLLYVSSIAAAILLVFNLGILNTKATSPTFVGLETATVETYILDENISAYEIAALLSDDQIENTANIPLGINKEQLETYLLETDDIDDLLLE